MQYSYFDRDLSWLSFNERILKEAARATVPTGERLNFLSIYSSNLDEFYRVRFPAVMALNRSLKKATISGDQQSAPETTLEGALERTDATLPDKDLLTAIKATIDRQQSAFGHILKQELIPAMASEQVYFLYDQPFPDFMETQVADYFFGVLAAYLNPVWMTLPLEPWSNPQNPKTGLEPQGPIDFFPENNEIYLAIFLHQTDRQMLGIVNVPATTVSRFFQVKEDGQDYVLLLDDIIRAHISCMVDQTDGPIHVEGCYSFKMTRDAEIDYKDEYGKDIASIIETQIAKRDFGLATRLLYDGDIPAEKLEVLVRVLHAGTSILVQGGRYHNLKDLAAFPVQKEDWRYPLWPARGYLLDDQKTGGGTPSIFDQLAQKDHLICPPYHQYQPVLRFFNEAAIRPEVTEISVTLYRIAGDSRIAHALINAAKNGKKVTVFVELKARFDEANNLKWARQMKEAGATIVYSIFALKVHAKVALVKCKQGGREQYFGIFATGNFNENTARFYADMVLLTANKTLLSELETLMVFLKKRTQPKAYDFFQPKNLLVAGFNLQSRLLDQIDTCIAAAKAGKNARIQIKVNNLEEQRLIDRLYDASNAGVKVELIVRSICRLIPGKTGMSENIEVRRLIDRFLEHSRVFIFQAGTKESVYLGSADLMNRNIYRRIEVCFPITDPALQIIVKQMIAMQLADNTQMVILNDHLENMPCPADAFDVEPSRRAQWDFFQYLTEDLP